jgi:hypothetical protein
MGYTPRPIEAADLADLRRILDEELREISSALNGVDRVLFTKLFVEPEKKEDGQVEYADGTSWNPGSGAGFYRWNGSAWIHLG